jgi:hypothetical protein
MNRNGGHAPRWTEEANDALLGAAATHTNAFGRVSWQAVKRDLGNLVNGRTLKAIALHHSALQERGTVTRTQARKPPAAWKPPELFVSNGHMSTTTVRHCPHCGYDLGRLLEAMHALQQIEDAHNG